MMIYGLKITTKSCFALAAAAAQISCCLCQMQAGVYDFGQGRQGEKRGTWTPGEWLAAILLVMTILLGLALAIGLCYYVNKRQRQRQQQQSSMGGANSRRQQRFEISLPPPGSGLASSKFVGLPGGVLTSGVASKTQIPIRPSNNNKSNTSRQITQTPNDSLIVQI